MVDLFNDLMMLLNFRDFGGIISQKDKDQGDSLQRTGIFYALMKLLNQPMDDRYQSLEEGYHQDMKQLECGWGVFHRSPNPTFWGFFPENCSRDQLSMARVAMSLMGDKARLWRSVIRQALRLGFHQNTRHNYTIPGMSEWTFKIPDISSPGEIGIIIRGLNLWVLYPVLLLVDLPLLFDDMLGKKDGWDYQNMAVLTIVHANQKMPTPWSKLAWKRYDKQAAKEQITRYYSATYNGIPPLGSIYCKMIDNQMGKK